MRFCPFRQMKQINCFEDKNHFFFQCENYENLCSLNFKNSWLSLSLYYSIMAANDKADMFTISSSLFTL